MYSGGRQKRRPNANRMGWVVFAWALFCAIQLHLAQLSQAKTSAAVPAERAIVVQAHASFRVQGSNGFRISVSGTPNGVRLVASRRHEAAIYLARNGSASEKGIHATFGRLGKVDLRFHALRNVRHGGEQTRCDLRDQDQYGYFTGLIVFRGERGFTRLRRQRLRGRATPARTFKCNGRPSQGFLQGAVRRTTSNKRPELSAGSVFPPRSFTAGGKAIEEILPLVRSGVTLSLANLPSAGVPYRAEAIDEHGYLLIIRILVAKGPADSLVLGPNNTATVSPPKPFSGEAEYHGCSSRSSSAWRGSLNVSLPGLANIKFGGHKFSATLKPGERCLPE